MTNCSLKLSNYRSTIQHPATPSACREGVLRRRVALKSSSRRSGVQSATARRAALSAERSKSTQRFPVALPEKQFASRRMLLFFDRCPALISLYLPQAALGSLSLSRLLWVLSCSGDKKVPRPRIQCYEYAKGDRIGSTVPPGDWSSPLQFAAMLKA